MRQFFEMPRKQEGSKLEFNAALVAPTEIDGEAIPCYECDYDLRGTSESARCPECGADANLSRERQSLLRSGQPVPLFMTSRKWLRTIAAASGLVVIGALVFMLATGASLIQTHAISRSLGALGSALIAMGYIISGVREPASPATRSTRTLMIAAWLAPLMGLLLPMASTRIATLTGLVRYSAPILFVNSLFIGAITWVLLWNMAKLAQRADAEYLRVFLSLLKWIAPVAWLCQPFLSTHLFLHPRFWVGVTPWALIGYADSVVMVPYSMAVFPRLTLELASMAGQAMISFDILVALTWFSCVLLRLALKKQEDSLPTS